MRKQAILLSALALPVLWPTAAWSQGIVSGAGAYAAAGGLGAGLAASSGHGKVVARSYEAMVKTQQAMLAQTQAIEQYMKLGCQFEAAKQWENAEKSFKYVLQVIAVRDGPGSSKGVPALKHLVAVSKEQNKLDQAIGYQKTVLAFTKGGTFDPVTTVREHCNLSNLYIKYGDYQSAAPVLKDAVTFCDTHPSLPIKDRQNTRSSYVNLLRKLHKDEEADAVETPQTNEEKSDGKPEKVTTEKPSSKPETSATEKHSGKPGKSFTEMQTGKPGQASVEMPSGKPEKSPTEMQTGKPEQSSVEMPSGKLDKLPTEMQTGKPEQSSVEMPNGKPEKSPTEMQTGKLEQSSTDIQTAKPEQPSVEMPTGKPEQSSIEMPSGKPEQSSISGESGKSDTLAPAKTDEQKSGSTDASQKAGPTTIDVQAGGPGQSASTMESKDQASKEMPQ